MTQEKEVLIVRTSENNNYNETLKKQIIFNLPFVQHFNEKEVEKILQFSNFAHVKKGVLFCNKPECQEQILIILKGKIKISLISDLGKEITISLLEKDDIIVRSKKAMIFDDSQYLIQVEEDCDLLKVNMTHIINETNKIYITEFIVRELRSNYDDLSRKLLSMLCQNLQTRIATIVLNEANNSKSDTVNLTHSQIANYLNSTREQVSRILGKFADEEIIELGYKKIIIKDNDALEDIQAAVSE